MIKVRNIQQSTQAALFESVSVSLFWKSMGFMHRKSDPANIVNQSESIETQPWRNFRVNRTARILYYCSASTKRTPLLFECRSISINQEILILSTVDSETNCSNSLCKIDSTRCTPKMPK